MATEVLPASLSGFHPTQAEKDHYTPLFNQADTEGLGVLTGDLAVPFFSHSSLPHSLLGEIWQVSDPENSGFLTPERFGVATRLIGHAQAAGGQGELDSQWITTPGPKAKFDDSPLSPPRPTPAATPASPPPSRPSQVVPQSTGSIVLVTPDERTKYSRLFATAGPANGLLDGDKARDIFLKSRLPFETLGKIWSLADTHSRGSLDAADFTLGMHLIQRTMNGDLPSLPTVLDPKLYASAIGPAVPAPQQQQQQQQGPATPQRQSTFPIPAQTTGGQQGGSLGWAITAPEKAEADGYFAGVVGPDGQTADGEKAVAFFSLSGLSVDVLAKVWDLADIRGSGALNRDEFAVALKLIRDRVQGKEVPETLPANFIPPSLRAAAAPAQPQRDLLDLDDDEPVPSSFSPQHTGSQSFSQPPSQSFSSPVLSPQQTGSGIANAPLAPLTSVFPQNTGNRLAPQGTGGSFHTPTAQRSMSPQVTGSRTLSPQTTGLGSSIQTRSNFFDENDHADTSSALHLASSNLAKAQQEHDTTSSNVAQLGKSREELEASLSSTTKELNELQVKLSAARASHEAERKMVDDLTVRQKEQAALLARQRTELITAESDLSALRVERTEIEGNYLRDKEDVRDMKRKMTEVATATAELKEVLEKMRKDARQQKGLVAISKKQLSTAELEKDKIASELEAEKARPAVVHSAPEEEEDSPFDHSTSRFDHHSLGVTPAAAAIALPTSPAALSPTSSVRSTNPFERMGSLSAAVSPQPTGNTSSAPHPAAPSSPQHDITSKGVDSEEPSFFSSPTAAVAAVGAGAVAAVTAIGAGVGSLVSGGDDDSKAHEQKEEGVHTSTSTSTQEPLEGKSIEEPVATAMHAEDLTTHKDEEDVVDPFGMPLKTSTPTAPGGDPFAVPESSSSTSKTTAAPSTFDDFDTGFGDDFSTAKPEAIHAAAASHTGFDDEFGSGFEPTPSAPVGSSSLPQHDASVVNSPAPPSLPDKDAFESQSSAPFGAGERGAHEPTQREASEGMERQEPDSSDDEDEIESAEPVHRGGGAATTSESSPAVPASTSDSGESFVVVPSESSKFPPLETLEEPSVLPSSDGHRSASPAADNFEAASAIPVSPGPTQDSESTTESGSSSAAPTKKRAAPPPPAGRSSISSASTAAPSPFDNSAFDASPFDAPPVASSSSNTPANDGFNSSFLGMPPALGGTSSSKAAAPPSYAGPSSNANDFDKFEEDDFFKDDFGPSTSTTSAMSGHKSSAGLSPDDDAAFADFDSAFDAPPTHAQSQSQAQAHLNNTADEAPAFSFDDAFGGNPPSSLADSLGPPPSAVPAASPALHDDVAGVKQITAMGFSRGQAIAALEKYNYRVEPAINSLLS